MSYQCEGQGCGACSDCNPHPSKEYILRICPRCDNEEYFEKEEPEDEACLLCVVTEAVERQTQG